MRDMGERLSTADVQQYFNAMDSNQDNAIDFQEFAAGMEKYILVRTACTRAAADDHA
jgi:Ca2+-binding EF-hand superfamily protein